MIDDTQDQAHSPRDIKFDDAARRALIRGIDKLTDAVRVTLGPGGRNVIIQRDRKAPLVTKDGVTVAQHVFLRDQHEDAGAQVVKEVASRTNETAGDGTTTATVLAQAIVSEGERVLAAGHSPKALKVGMRTACRGIIGHLRDIVRPVVTSEQIAQVGTISANGDVNIGDILARAMDRVGSQGIINIDEAKGFETQLELVDGVRLERGYTSPYFVNDVERMRVEYSDAYVLISDRQFTTMADLVPIMERVSKTGRPVLIIADEVRDEALKLLTMNKMRGSLQCCVIVAPGRGDHRNNILSDLATMLGGNVITEGDGRMGSEITLDDLGQCEKVTVTRSVTSLIMCMGDENARAERQRNLEEQLSGDPTLDDVDVRRLQERLSLLGGAAAIVKVGGATEVELGERKDRIIDALNATQAATEEGIVPGGGIALHAASRMFDIDTLTGDERVGAGIVVRACLAPMRQILTNAGHNAERTLAMLDDVDDPWMGFDATTGDVTDMFDAGVFDPLKVTRCALENAVSVGSTVLTVGASIVAMGDH